MSINARRQDAVLVQGALLGVDAGDMRVPLVRTNGIIRAIGRICTREDADRAEGQLNRGCVVCSLHGNQIDVITGESLTPPAVLPEPVYGVLAVEGVVYVAALPEGGT